MRDALSPFIDRKRPAELSEIPASLYKADESAPTSETRPTVVRTGRSEPNSFYFDRSPETRRESILVLRERMAAQDGSAAVDSLLLDAIRYFRPAA